MCRLLNVTRSGFYNWIQAQPSARQKENEMLVEKVKRIFNESFNTYGTRRIRKMLLKEDLTVSRRRIGKLMRSMGLSCKTKKKFKVTTDSAHQLPISKNWLSRRFDIGQPDKCYVSDITYIRTQEGWLYLAVVIDLFSRKVVGWSMDKTIKAELVNNALLAAIWARKPAKGLISHSDRGSQYASASHRKILEEHGEPKKESGNVDTWKIKVETKPKQKYLPAQRINIDVCSIPSYEKQPMLLLNPYGIDMGTSGLVVQAQSREEIYADKLLAFALRPNRLKHRDLWDISRLHQQNIKPRIELIPNKLKDRKTTVRRFLDLFTERQNLLASDKTLENDFKKEMQRFLPSNQWDASIGNGELWKFIIFLMKEFDRSLQEKFLN
jgi:hypothetical protein